MFTTQPRTRTSHYHMRQAKRRNAQRFSFLKAPVFWGLILCAICFGLMYAHDLSMGLV